MPQQSLLIAAAMKALNDGYNEEDFLRLADFVRLGGVAWRKAAWDQISRQFVTELTKALDWDGKSDPRARSGGEGGRRRIGSTCRVAPGTVTITKNGVTETKALSDFKAPADGSVM